MSSRRYFTRSPNQSERPRARPLPYYPPSPSRSSHSSSHRYYSRHRSSGAVNGHSSSHSSSHSSRSWSSRPPEPLVQERREVSSLLSLNELPAREKLLVPEVLDAEETQVVEKTIDAFKSRGHFDDFRKEFLDGIEKLPSYKSLRYKVMSTVSKYIARQGPFHPGMRKNKMRDGLKDELNREYNGLSSWINDLVDDLIGPNVERRIRSVVKDTLEDYIPDEKIEVASFLNQDNQEHLAMGIPMTSGNASHRPERLPTPPPLEKYYSEQLTMAKLERERQEAARAPEMALTSGDAGNYGQFEDGGPASPVAPVPVDEDTGDENENKTSAVLPQLLFNQLAHFSMYPQDAPPELREALLNSQAANMPPVSSAQIGDISVMVDESPTGVEDIISPEMMDIEDGHSPDPTANTEIWSADESVTTADSVDNDNRVSTDLASLTPSRSSSNQANPSDDANQLVPGSAKNPSQGRSTLGSLLLEKRKLKMRSAVVSKPTPIRKQSNSDIESISSESDFDSTSSSSSGSSSSDEERLIPNMDTITRHQKLSSSAAVSPNKLRTPGSIGDSFGSSRESRRDSRGSPHHSRESDREHVSRYGRKGRQPSRYSPDSEKKKSTPMSESPSKRDRSTPKKHSKSTPKRFYPGNSPSMLLKRKRSPSPPKEDVVSPKKKEKAPPIEDERPESRQMTPPVEKTRDEVSSTIERVRVSSSRSEAKSRTTEERSRKKDMPQVHLSSRRSRRETTPSVDTNRSDAESSGSRSRVERDSQSEKRSASRNFSDHSDRDNDRKSSRKYERRQEKEDVSRNMDERDKETKLKPISVAESSKGSSPIDKKQSSSDERPVDKEAKETTEEMKESAEITVSVTKEELEVKDEPTASPKKEKVRTENEEVEEGEITDDEEDEQTENPNDQEIAPSVVQSKSFDRETSPPLRATKLHPHISASRSDKLIEFPPAPPPLPPLRKKKSKRKRNVSTSSESDESSDDSLMERLAKKDIKNRTNRVVPPTMPPFQTEFVVGDQFARTPFRGPGPVEDPYIPKSFVVDESLREDRKRAAPMSSKIVVEKDLTKQRLPHTSVRNKDSWFASSRHASSVGKREAQRCHLSLASRYRSGSRSPTRQKRRRNSRSRSSSSRLDKKGTDKVPRQYKDDEKRALSPEFHEKGTLSPPPMLYDKTLPKVRLLSGNEKKKSPRHSKSKQHHELPPPPPLTRKVPYPPPPMASLADDASTDSAASSRSGSSDESSSSSSSAEKKLRAKKLKSRHQNKVAKATAVSNERHRKISYHLGSESKSSRSHGSRSYPASRKIEDQNWSGNDYKSSYGDRSDEEQSSQASSDDVLISNSHTPPRCR